MKFIEKPFYSSNRALVERTLFGSKTNLGLQLKSVAHDFMPSKVLFAMGLNFELFFNIRIHIGENGPLQKNMSQFGSLKYFL